MRNKAQVLLEAPVVLRGLSASEITTNDNSWGAPKLQRENVCRLRYSQSNCSGTFPQADHLPLLERLPSNSHEPHFPPHLIDSQPTHTTFLFPHLIMVAIVDTTPIDPTAPPKKKAVSYTTLALGAGKYFSFVQSGRGAARLRTG